MGALFTAVTMSVEPRFKAVMLVVAGSPMSEILATSRQMNVRKLRRDRMRANNFATELEYQAALEQAMEIDLDSLVTGKPKMPLKMIIATDDGSVPSKTQLQLWEAFGRPENLKVDSGHPHTVIKTFLSHSKVVRRFFNKHMW
jgi:hypothetical protein